MVPSELLIKLNECAGSNFHAARDSWLFKQTVSEHVVIWGLVFEAPELLHEMYSIAQRRFQTLKYKVSETAVEYAKIAAALGWVLIVLGLFGELKATSEIARISASIEECSDAKLQKATLDAGDAASSAKIAHDEADSVKGIADEARSDAKDALSKAKTAQAELARSEADAAKAQKAASDALGTATKAEQVARDTKNEVAETAEELRRVKTQRSLLHAEKVIAALRQFSGTEYVFSSVGQDEESVILLRQIDDILGKAGWKRQPAHGQFPALNVFGSKGDESVTVTVLSGVMVSIDSKEEFTALQAKQIADLPEHIRAAISLNANIAANLYPPQEKGKTVDVAKGDSTVVRIVVGHKP